MSDQTNDLVTEAARLIEPDWFDPEWIDAATGESPALLKSKRAYMQAKWRNAAWQVLKLAAKTPNLRRVLAEIEKDDWQNLGVPVRGNPKLEAVIDGKFQP